jgi:hypothetical protein
MTVIEHQSLALLTLSENRTGSGVWGLGLTVCDGLCYGKKKKRNERSSRGSYTSPIATVAIHLLQQEATGCHENSRTLCDHWKLPILAGISQNAHLNGTA